MTGAPAPVLRRFADLASARAAVAFDGRGSPFLLVSEEGAVRRYGAAFLLIVAAKALEPGAPALVVLDCGDDDAAALDAVEAGARAIFFDGDRPALDGFAAARGVEILKR